MATVIEGIKFYTIQETASALRVTPQTIRAYIKRGRIKSQRIGRPILIKEDNLRELITNNEKENLSENQREMVANLRSLLSDIEANRETAENELRRRREAEDNPNQP